VELTYTVFVLEITLLSFYGLLIISTSFYDLKKTFVLLKVFD